MNTAEKIPITKDNAKRGVAICPRQNFYHSILISAYVNPKKV